MARKNNPSLPAVHVSSLLFVCALLPAFLYKGPQIEFFAITQIVLVMWLGWAVFHSYDSGFHIPKTSLALCLTLFWLWLAVSLAWSLAPSVSVINFWWVGSLALVFWLFTLTPDREALWRHSAAILLVVGVVLALMGIYQVLVQDQQARSVFQTRNSQAACLNLVAFLAATFFLKTSGARQAMSRQYHVILAIVLFIVFVSLFVTASRGATLSLVIGMGLLTVLTLRTVPKQTLALLWGLLIAAFLLTKMIHGELGGRIAGLVEDSPRRMIWESSWQMLKNSPWQGIGLGLYYLAYPSFRNPQDATGGFFAHNDYLQIWIETGLPGLLLLLAVLITTLWLFARTLRKTGLRGDRHIEMSGLFCGLLAVAGHSIVDFNLYILSIMMIAALMLARLHDLAVGELKIASLRLRPGKTVGKPAYLIIVVLLTLLPFFYFVALGMANSYYDKGLELAQVGKLQEADQSLMTAHRLTPADDRMLIALADLYRHTIRLLPPDSESSKKVLYEDAVGFLDKADSVNSLRAISHVIRARLYQENPDFAGEDWQALAAGAFRRGLDQNPLLFQGRVEYAELLLQQGRKEDALQVVDEGAKYRYFDIPEQIPYYTLTASLLRDAGRLGDAFLMQRRVSDLKQQERSGFRLRGY